MLWEELVARGFRGALRTVQRHVVTWPTNDPYRRRERRRRDRVPVGTQVPVKPPSPRQARWWLVLPAARLVPMQHRYVERLVGACPALANARALVTDFGALVGAHDAAGLVPWLEHAAASEHAEYRDLATSLRRDLVAVTAAVREPWSDGQTEGQVNKLKMLKRQMYGRASVALLRKRPLHAA